MAKRASKYRGLLEDAAAVEPAATGLVVRVGALLVAPALEQVVLVLAPGALVVHAQVAVVCEFRKEEENKKKKLGSNTYNILSGCFKFSTIVSCFVTISLTAALGAGVRPANTPKGALAARNHLCRALLHAHTVQQVVLQ